MRIFKMIDYYMLRHWPRYRLFRICKAIGIKPYLWQRWFALGEIDHLPEDIMEMRSGKTTACFLRVLMITTNNYSSWKLAGSILSSDPNCVEQNLYWYSKEYRRLKKLCLAAGIPVLQVEVYRMIEAYNRRW